MTNETDKEKEQNFNTEFLAMLEQVSASTTEISGSINSEKHNINIIKHNLGDATTELKELATDAASEAELGKDIFRDIDNKLSSIQSASTQSMCQAAKAEKQKPMFAALEKMIGIVIASLEDIKEEIMEPMHVLAVNGAIQANRYRAGSTGGLSGVLNKVSGFTDELAEKSKAKIETLIRTLEPYIETAKRLAVTNDEFFLAATSAAKQMEKTYGIVEEIKIGCSGMVDMIGSLKDKSEHITNNLENIDNMTNEFASSISQTNDAIKEIQDSIIAVSKEYHEHRDIIENCKQDINFNKKWNWEEIQKIAETIEIETAQGVPVYCFLTIDQAEIIERIANEIGATSQDLKNLIIDAFKKFTIYAREDLLCKTK